MVRPGGGAFQKALSPAPPGFSLSGPGEPFLQKTTGVFPGFNSGKEHAPEGSAEYRAHRRNDIAREADANVPPAGGALPGVPL